MLMWMKMIDVNENNNGEVKVLRCVVKKESD